MEVVVLTLVYLIVLFVTFFVIAQQDGGTTALVWFGLTGLILGVAMVGASVTSDLRWHFARRKRNILTEVRFAIVVVAIGAVVAPIATLIVFAISDWTWQPFLLVGSTAAWQSWGLSNLLFIGPMVVAALVLFAIRRVESRRRSRAA